MSKKDKPRSPLPKIKPQLVFAFTFQLVWWVLRVQHDPSMWMEMDELILSLLNLWV